MTRTSLILTGLIGLLTTVPAAAQTETESFSPEPKSDWLEYESRHPDFMFDFGWDDGSGNNQFESANTFGKSPEWGGGLFTRSDLPNAIYADVTIGNYTMDDPLHAHGSFWWDETIPKPDGSSNRFNGQIHVGFLDARDVMIPTRTTQERQDCDTCTVFPDFMGFDVLEDLRTRSVFSSDEEWDGTLSQRTSRSGFGTTWERTHLEFEIDYDPDDPGGFREGKLTTVIRNVDTGEESVKELFMPFLGRDVGANFNAFGIWLQGPQARPNIELAGELFIDDVEYTSNDTCGAQEVCDQLDDGGDVTNIAIIAGDSDLNGAFDTGDIVFALSGGKFESGNPATWPEGDWNAAGDPAFTYASLDTGGGDPPPGNGVFDTSDIVAALAGGNFEQGSVLVAALKDPAKGEGTNQVVVTYDAADGNVSVNATEPITSISLESASGIFTGSAAANLGGPFDVDTDVKVFKAVFGNQFSEVDFGAVGAANLAKGFLLDDLTASGSLAGGGGTFGPDVQLNYVPEPSTFILFTLALVGLTGRHRR